MSRFFSRPLLLPSAAKIRAGVAAGLIMLVAGCANTPSVPSGAAPEELARRQRIERAQTNLNDGLKQYEAGSYEGAKTNLLIALDSGVLSVPQQLNARKHMAFIQCVNNRELG